MKTAVAFTCKLTDKELRERKVTVIGELRSLVRRKSELYDGFSYEFEASDKILDKINEFIKTERLCCDFFEFQVSIRQETLIMSIKGPDGVKDFISNEIEF